MELVCFQCGCRFNDEYKICPYCGKNVTAPEGKEAEIEAELEKVEMLWKNYRYDESYPILLKLAKDGNPHAQYSLGFLYEQPTDGHCTYKQAEYWYKKSAEQGYPPAMYIMGAWYEYSDPQQAAYWYQKAAAKGNNQALFRLGFLYEKGGTGLELDLEKAADIYQKVLELDSTYSDARRGLERINRKLNK